MSAAGDKPDAWMPLYVADWDAGTRHLSCEEDGAYGRLVRHYWKNGALPDDDAQLARIVGADRGRWRRLRGVLETFFTVADGRWTHARVEAELATWGEKRRRFIERAAAGGRAKAAAHRRCGAARDGAGADGWGEGWTGGWDRLPGDRDSDIGGDVAADADGLFGPDDAPRAAPRSSAKSSSQAVLKPCTSSSASSAEGRTPPRVLCGASPA